MNSTPEPAAQVLVLTRLLNAPRELVFQVWTEPRHLIRWWGPTDFTLPFCEMDFRPGGAYRFCMRAPDGSDHWVWGVYQEIVAPERLSFTWNRTQTPAMQDPWARTIVSVTFTEERGLTKLTLHQATFQKPEECTDHRGGWTECLDRLAALVAQQSSTHNQPRPS